MSHEERRLAAIMFTDMVGYTSLTQRDEALGLQLVEEQRKLVRPILARHNGREVKTMGDAFLVEFRSALAAVRCASDIQRAAREFNVTLPADRKILLRVGVHLGDVVESEGGDISGDAVNIASRIERLAEEGGVSITRQVYDQVHNKFELSIESLGTKQLKNVRVPLEVYRVVMPWESPPDSKTPFSEENRVAVLPFANMSPDTGDEYFADGMTEEVISSLSKISELSIISRTSVMQYKKKLDKTVGDIGKELRVGTLLQGSVRKKGDRVRISIQMIDVESDRSLWSENYERNIEDVFDIQVEIAESVARSLRIRLVGTGDAKIKTSSTHSADAHLLYLKGLVLSGKRSKEGIEKSIKYYSQAVEIDPAYAAAYAAMADSFLRLGFYELRPSKEVFPKARQFAEKALQIDQGLPEAHLCLGSIFRGSEWDYQAAEEEFRKVIELNPSLAEAHSRLAPMLLEAGRPREAIEELRRALELDPLSSDTLATGGVVSLYARQYEEAVRLLTDALELDPGNRFAAHNLGLALVQKGRLEEGIKRIENALEMSDTRGPLNLMELAYAYSKTGKTAAVEKILSELVEGSHDNPAWSGAMAGVYLSLGKKDEALKWLERALDEHAGFLRAHIQTDFVFDPLRSDRRFKALLERMSIRN